MATVPYPYPNNSAFIREYTVKLLSSSFPNMTTAEVLKQIFVVQVFSVLLPPGASTFICFCALFQVAQFVSGLFESREDDSSFKNHIRDFLIQSKEFSAQVKYLFLSFVCTTRLVVNLSEDASTAEL